METKDLKTHRSGQLHIKPYEELMVNQILGTTRSNEPLQAVVENQLNEFALKEQDNSILERNRALLQYFATIANSNSSKDEFNYEFVESLVKGGADMNIADQHGQTIFHEVARSWNTDIAYFLIHLGGDVNKQDNFGRSPLHVASAVDYVEMTEFLLVNNADIDSKTYGEIQTPIHYAAKNGATRSLKMLLSFHANIDTLDAKQRTPLQVAAEWGRGKTAKILIAEGAASCLLDITGNSALCVLIEHLPNLAIEALNQLHISDVITSREYYYLQHLETSRQKVETKTVRTPLETAVANRKYEVVTHPVMQRLVHNKWKQYGWFSTAVHLLFHVAFGIAWTAFSIGTPRHGKDVYNEFVDRVWKITLGVTILLMTLYDIGKHVQATFKSRRSQRNWIRWKMEQLEYDLKYCHPRWPQEKKFVKTEMKRVRALPLFDAYDAWFYMDWIILFLIVASIATHFVFLYLDTRTTWYIYTRTISIMNLLVWLRLLKFVRPFPGIGTLVLILSKTMGDFMNWAFLFFLIMVPFAASFWINFGPRSIHPVHGYHTTGELLYRVFQIAVGDDFNLEEIVAADAVAARILVVLYVIAMTIVTLNLLIALLSDTFTRVYSNAVSNTIMQRAIKIVESERCLTKSKKSHYKEHMRMNCSPEIIKIQVAPWNKGKESKAIEAEVYDDILNAKSILNDRCGKIYGKDKTSDFDGVVKDVRKICQHDDDVVNDLEEIRKMLNLGTSGKPTHFRQVRIKSPDSARERKGGSRDSRSPQKQESKGFVSTLQEMLPRWFTGNAEDSLRGNKRRHRPNTTSQTQNGVVKERRRRRQSRRRGDVLENRQEERYQSQETELRRRGRRKNRKKEHVLEGYPNPGYDQNLAWDTVSIDSSPV